jgi:molybdate transport system ATP-binding protein
MIQARIRKHFEATPDSPGFTLDVDLVASSGVTVLFGPSGAGKTLTLDAIAGFVRPDEGRILLDDAILFDAATGVHLPPQARRCGYVFQNYALFPHMTIRQNLEFAAERSPRLERYRLVNEMLEKFRIAEVAGRKPNQISGGQKQRCSIARALLGAPRVILLDEPARGLDAPLRSELYAELRRVRREFKTPIVVVTHDLDECFELGDEMVVLREGRVVQTGAPESVLRQPASLEVARLLGLFCLVPAEVRALDPGANTSSLAVGEQELRGPYLPGRFKGDRVSIFARPDRLRAMPRNGRPGANQLPARLDHAVETPSGVRLEFAEGYRVEIDRAAYARDAAVREWWVEFPAPEIRVI